VSKLVAIDGDSRRLDRFELVAELATGGMATVFLARLSGVGGFQRFVAIKRLHPHLAREPEFIEMFLEEARLAARIHHPNVVPILEIGTSDEGYYIVMEYVEGDTLGRLLARSAQTGQRLPTKVGLRVVIDMLAGLDAAHELKDDDDQPLGIVHRDISPQNVLVGVDGSSRLSDFGVARATSKLSTTRTGQLKGKLAYMAPEQAKGARDIDRRADIFASGVVLWEVLACRRLFKGDGEADTLNRVLNEPIPPVRSAAPTVPAALEAVVGRALERDRTKRYTSAAEFAEALERASRVVGALGTHKDVAAHLEAVLGTQISQQREAVRAWLARSEPSRHGMEPRPEVTSVTKVDREGSLPKLGRGSDSLPRLGADPGTTSGVSSVSSVTSAVSPPEAPLPSPLPVLPSAGPRRRGALVPVAFVLGVLAVGAVAWMKLGKGMLAPPVVAAAGPSVAVAAPPPVPVTAAPSSAPALDSTPASSASAATSASAAASVSAPPVTRPPSGGGGGGGWHPGRPVVAVSPPPPAPATAAPPPAPTPAPAPPPAPAVPDDISRNPYR
jgi:serine/threonine-protein kinase